MNDDLTSDPGPVAEYRDPELVRRFAAGPVPGHGPDFWDDLEVALSGRPPSTVPSGPGIRPGSRRPLASGAGDDTAELPAVPAGAGAQRFPVGSGHRRWGTGRWLAAAAAILAVAGAGSLAVALANRASSPIVSAAPSSSEPAPTTTAAPDPAREAPPATTTVPAPRSTTTAPAVSPPPSADDSVDYFAGGATVVAIGTGRAVGFSPDDSAVLVLDDGPGSRRGCEDAPLLALYAQDLATGDRVPALTDGSPIETGGLDLAISPHGSTPAEVGTRPVYWTDYCDGSRSSTRRGVLAPDGTISMIEDVEPGGEDDPFAAGNEGRRRPSPDGTEELIVEEGAVRVVPVGDPSAGVDLPASDPADEPTYRTGAWAPGGAVVAVAADDGVVLWNPATGDRHRYDASEVVDLTFDNSGRRLAVASATEVGYTSNILTFGGLPDPVSAPERCSGRVELDPIEARTMVAAGAPTEVVATVTAIDRAAATCDWAALGDLTGPRFTASFGGSDPVTLWRSAEAAGESPMWTLRELLRQPSGVVEGEGGSPSLHVWPSVYLRTDCDFAEDRKTLAALGYRQEDAERDCEQLGGYAGYRTGIDADGSWRYFVAGD